MPTLDRRITVNVTSETTRDDQGGDVPGTVTALGKWATRNDLTTEDIKQAGGVLGIVTRDYVIRFDERIAMTPAGRLSIVDGVSVLNVTNMTEAREGRERNRYIRLQATGETNP